MTPDAARVAIRVATRFSATRLSVGTRTRGHARPSKALAFTDSCVQSPSGSATSSGRLKLPPAPVTGTRRSPLGHRQVDHLRRPRFMQVDDETPPLRVIAPDSRSLSKLD